MTTKQLITTLSTLGLATHLLFNPTLAEDTTPPTPPTTPPSSATTAAPTPAEAAKPATDTTAKPAVPEESSAAKKLAPGSVKNPELEAAVKGYIESWQKKDFKAMQSYENWDGGATLDEIGYIKALDTNFQINTWQITQVRPLSENDYKVLVLVTHSPPREIAALVPAGQTVRSTLNQWWRKVGDKYVHLFNIERQNLLRYNTPAATPPPAPFKGVFPPVTTEESKKDESGNHAKPAEDKEDKKD